MLMVGFQSPGIILWSRHSIGGLSCLGGGLRSLSALVQASVSTKQTADTQSLIPLSLSVKYNLFTDLTKPRVIYRNNDLKHITSIGYNFDSYIY